MNPVKIFKQLVRGTVFNSGASAFLQAIAGHQPENHPVTLKKNLQHIQKEAQEAQARIDSDKSDNVDNDKQMEEAIDLLKGNVDMRESMEKQASSYFKKHLSPEAVVEKILKR